MHGRIAIKLEKDIYGEIRRNVVDGVANLGILFELGVQIMDGLTESNRLKQEFYDETTEYFHEALAIAETTKSQLFILLSSQIYLRLCSLELIKEGAGNLRKALEYKAEGLLKFGKLDQSFKMENPGGIEIVLDLIEDLSDDIIYQILLV